MRKLEDICLSHGVRAREREYVRRLTLEFLEENRELILKEGIMSYDKLISSLQ